MRFAVRATPQRRDYPKPRAFQDGGLVNPPTLEGYHRNRPLPALPGYRPGPTLPSPRGGGRTMPAAPGYRPPSTPFTSFPDPPRKWSSDD
jgi:hypothetical protein